jgi:HD superfamily phosphodiesterase
MSDEIILAESLYRQKLEEYFSNVFRNSNLQSHGLDHHRRVWSYCRELLTYPEASGKIKGKNIPQKLLIAAYLHDSGMAIDPGPRHGHISRMFCEQFLKENSLDAGEFTDLLEAVENHDIKEYSGESNENDLLITLSVADDLDALGYTGIYRYLEIYIKRGIPYHDLGTHINTNVSGRFRNLVRKFGDAESLIEREGKRYEIISEFCTNYNNQLKDYIFGIDSISKYCGIAELIGEIPDNKADINILISRVYSGKYDIIIKNFFDALRKELRKGDK